MWAVVNSLRCGAGGLQIKLPKDRLLRLVPFIKETPTDPTQLSHDHGVGADHLMPCPPFLVCQMGRSLADVTPRAVTFADFFCICSL